MLIFLLVINLQILNIIYLQVGAMAHGRIETDYTEDYIASKSQHFSFRTIFL